MNKNLRILKKNTNFAAVFAHMDTIIDLDKLELGVHQFDFQLDDAYIQSIEKTELLGGTIQAKAKVVLRPNDLELTIKAQGKVQVTCDRCLDPMDIVVDEEDEMEVEEGAKSLDLSWLAYELIIVNLPLVHSHQPGGCNPQMDKLLQDHLCSSADDPDTIG